VSALTWKLIALALLAVACAHGPRAPLVSRGGQVTITNMTGESVEVFASGTRVGRLANGASTTVDKLAVGEVAFEAVGLQTGSHLRATFELDPSNPQSWQIRPTPEQSEALKKLPTGRVEVRNRSPEPVRVFVDGEPREMVWPAAEAQYAGLAHGPHQLRAEGVRSGFVVHSQVTVSTGVSPVFEVRPPSSALRVTNRSTMVALVTLEGYGARELQPGASYTWPDLAPGTYQVEATDHAHRPLWQAEVRVKAGEVSEATVPLPPGVLAVVSDLPVPVTIVADGCRLGDIQAHGAGEFRGLPPGHTRVQAIGPDGEVVARTRLNVPAQGQATWLAKPGSGSETALDEGSLVVVNDTPEPIMIRVDGWDRGHCAPGGKRIVPNLLPGKHLVAALGERSHDQYKASLDLSPGAEVTWKVVPGVATLAMRNLRSEEVRLIMDGAEIGRLAPAETRDFTLPAGRHELEVRGVTTLNSTLHTLDLQAGLKTELPLAAPTATLVVTNLQSDPLAIGYDDRELGVILPQDRVTLRDVAPGTHRLFARSTVRPLSWTLPVTLGPGEEYHWDLQK